MVSLQVTMDPGLVTDLGYAIGFDMSAMKEEVYGEAIVDVVKPGTLVSEPVIIKVRRNKKMYGHSLPIPFPPVGHIRPGRTIPSAQLPIIILPRVHLDQTHENPHVCVTL